MLNKNLKFKRVIEEKDIELVMTKRKVTKEEVIKALRENEDVEAMQLGEKLDVKIYEEMSDLEDDI